MAASRMSLKSDLRSSLSASLGSSLGQLVHEGEITTKEAVEVLSSSLPDMDGGPMTGTTLAEETTPTRKTQKKQTRRVWSAPEFTSTKPQPKHDWIGTLRSHPKRKKLGRKTSKLKLQKLIKSKMLGFKFVSHVTEQAELHKKKEEKRQQDANVVKTWLANKTKKKGTKKKPLFDLRSYSAKTGETNVHTLKLGGMRHPYDLQGVQFVPAERLGAWRKEEGREKWSSSFHTAKFPLPPNRAQTHKLKNEATPRRAIQPKLITFGGYGEVEWFTCLKATDAHYQLHAENMTRLQMARRLLDAQRKKKR